jgi:hypothetical protein
MEQFAVEALNLCQGVSMALAPLLDAGKVLLFLGVGQGDSFCTEVPAKAEIWDNLAERDRF